MACVVNASFSDISATSPNSLSPAVMNAAASAAGNRCSGTTFTAGATRAASVVAAAVGNHARPVAASVHVCLLTLASTFFFSTGVGLSMCVVVDKETDSKIDSDKKESLRKVAPPQPQHHKCMSRVRTCYI